MHLDPTNPVIALCAAGMAVEGEPQKAQALFEQAWAARQDDFDASVAAHFLARHQPTPEATLEWNRVALAHADALNDDRACDLLPSLCLNLADSLLLAERREEALAAARRARTAADSLPPSGYADFVRAGIDRVLARILASANGNSATRITTD